MEEEEIQNKAKLVAARNHARRLLRYCSAPPPVLLREVVNQVKTEFKLTVAGTKNGLPEKVDAVTHKDEAGVIIAYNQNSSVVRQRFSLAHEIGHLYMGHVHGSSSLDLNSVNNDEVEANIFAAELLMPQKLLRKDIKDGIKDPKQLAQRYNVSIDAMWWRLRGVGLINKL